MSSLSSGLYLPLAALLGLYAVLSIVAQVAQGRGNPDRAEGLRGVAFGIALLAAAYTVVLLIAAAASYPDRLFDALTIMVVVVGFFVVLLLAFFVLFELLVNRVGRRARR
jgi:hypothetical protein